MVNATNSNAEWRPRFAPPALKSEVPVQAFSLSTELPTKKEDGFDAFGDDGFTVLDAIDIVNPLQHLPFVGTVYRELTGDTLDPFSRVAGSTLFFGPIGAAASAANVVMEAFTGKDVGAHMMAFITEPEHKTGNLEIASLEGTANLAGGETSLMPTAAGTDGMDPVTSWALNEMQFRKAEAEKRGIAVPERSYTALVDQAVSATASIAEVVRPPATWSKPLDQEAAVVMPNNMPKATLADRKAANEPDQQVLNAFQAEHHASPETLLRLKKTTAAYQTVNFETTPSQPKRTDRQGLKDNDSTAAAAKPQRLAPATDRRPIPTSELKHANNWFSASMVDALGKYQNANGTDKSALNQLTSKSSLH